MTSSVLAGERRWASARRSGMTVLGKVAAPKPLNLPSQKLENHGLDPNVEIVPKGTASWGNRSSSSSSSAWGSSTLSPNTDGGTNSPTHLSGRPSSGGSGTRPSTACSDRLHEPTANAWGPNPRPSSASGSLTSSQTSLTSLRPRSAETRPCSSQLSRFAEPASDNSIAWGPSGTAQKLGAASSTRDEFSLSSGDFPTLGSEKDSTLKNSEPRDHLRPSSSSGRIVPEKERAVTSQADQKNGNADTWKENAPHNIEDGVQHRVENWQGDSKQYPNADIPPQPFDVWRGHPVNAAPGVWYRGPPYGAPVAPSGFPIEPFPYYRPQIPPNLAHSQPVPSMGPGPRGPHPKNDDLYRPHMAEAYIRPGMPIRPGFYPGPMAYEGYYGPPVGYCNSSERDVPFMGMPASPSVYNRFPTRNAPPSNVHAGVGGHSSTAKASVSEKGKSNNLDDSQEPYKVLQKQQNHLDRKEEEENMKHTEHTNVLHVGDGDEARNLSGNNEFRVDGRRNEIDLRGASYPIDHTRSDEKYSRITPTEFSRTPPNQGGNSLDSVKANAKDSMVNTKMVDDSWARKSESAASSFPQGPKIVATSPKDSTLIQMIEGLNAKTRASDGRHDVFTSSREEQKKQIQVSHKDKNPINDAGDVAICPNIIHADGNPIPGSLELDVLTEEKASLPTVSTSSGMIISRRDHHGVQGRVDHRRKGRFSTESADGWRKRSVAVESSTAAPTIHFEPSTDFHAQDHNSSKEVDAKSVIDLPAKVEGELPAPNLDSSGGQAHRAKMRELTKQRALQLQREEEERTREQKAKALAKLEELNRRSQVGDSSMQKVEEPQQGSGLQWKQEESTSDADRLVMVETKFEEPSSDLVSHINIVTQCMQTSSTDVGQSTTIPKESPRGMLRNSDHEVHPHVQSLSSEQEFHKADSRADDVVVPQVRDKTIPRNKRMGYKQKQNVLAETNSTGKSAPINTNEAPTNNGDLLVNDSATSQVVPYEVVSGGVPNNSNITMDPTAQHQKRKNNRGAKNKPRMDDASSSTSLTALKETHSAEPSTENTMPNVPPSELGPSSGQSVTDAKDCVACMEQHPSIPIEEAHSRETNQWKSQRFRRIPRNSQANRFADRFHCSDTVVWAPVRSQNKAEVMNEAIEKTVTDAVNPDSKSDGVIQSNIRSKRAEMKRYIPKPVAKELAQQGCILQPGLSSSEQTADEPGGRMDVQSAERYKPESVAIENTGLTAESKNGYNKQSKQAKVHGAWRQRGAADAPHGQGLHEISSTSDPKNAVEQHQSLKPDLDLAKDGLKSSDMKTFNGGNTSNIVDPAVAPVSSVLKEQESTGKGKRHTFRGHRIIANDQDDCVNDNSGEPEKITLQFGILEMGQAERIIASMEHPRTGEGALSRWQPKSRTNDQLGSSSTVVQNISTEVGRDTKKDPSPSNGLHHPPQHDGERNKTTAQPHSDQTVGEYKNTKEAPNFGHQEGRRDRRMASSQRRPYSPVQGPVSIDEKARHGSTNAQHEQRVSSEFHKNGNRSNRPEKRHESRGDWSSSRQDNRQHGVPASRERHGQSSHYEYQAVGPYYSGKSNNFEGLDFSQSHNTVSRYRERGQGHSRRGGGGGSFHGRDSGTVHVDSSCG